MPLGRSTVGDVPVISLPAFFGYEPNVAGAIWFCHDVFPAVREVLDDHVVLRLIGHGADRLDSLRKEAGITVVGPVEHIETELLVPISSSFLFTSQAGRRVKVMEAFAHRIPVVTTTKGVEGLGVETGVHALVADSPAEFVEAVIALLRDQELRETMTAAAQTLYARRYSAEDVRGHIAEMAQTIMRAS